MNRFLILWIYTLSACFFDVVAQSRIDSLKALLKTTPRGTDKFKLFGGISWAYAGTRSQLDLAMQYADSIRILAEELNDEGGIAYSHFYYGVVDRFRGNYSQGLNHLAKFVNYYAAHGDSSRVASGLFQIGVINHDIGNYDKSLLAYHRILVIRQKENNHYAIGFTLNSIGVILKKMKRYDDAIEKYNSALEIFDSLDAEDRCYVRINIANLYAELSKFEEASVY